MDRSKLGVLGLGLGLVMGSTAAGCSGPNPAFDPSEDTGTRGSASGEGSGTAAEPNTAAGPGEGSGGATSGTTASLDSTASAASTAEGQGSTDGDCGEIVIDDDAYAPCFDNFCEAGECVAAPSVGPVFYELSVCEPQCLSDCDCPTTSTGAALPVCEDQGCALDCSGGEPCPDGMMCEPGTERCMWNDAYGPCDDSCSSGRCIGFTEEPWEVCPALTCWAGGALPDELCPPPPGGDATPFCFEPGFPRQFEGEGWCALMCTEGVTECPPGMFCAGELCVHP